MQAAKGLGKRSGKDRTSLLESQRGFGKCTQKPLPWHFDVSNAFGCFKFWVWHDCLVTDCYMMLGAAPCSHVVNKKWFVYFCCSSIPSVTGKAFLWLHSPMIPFHPLHSVPSIHSVPFHSSPFHSIPFRSIPFQPTHPSIQSFVDSFIPSILHSLIHRFVHPPIHPSIHPSIHPLIHPPIHPSIQTIPPIASMYRYDLQAGGITWVTHCFFSYWVGVKSSIIARQTEEAKSLWNHKDTWITHGK